MEAVVNSRLTNIAQRIKKKRLGKVSKELNGMGKENPFKHLTRWQKARAKRLINELKIEMKNGNS